MLSLLRAQQGDKKIRCAVDHFRLAGKALYGVNEADQFYDPHDPVEIAAKRRLHLGEDVQRAGLGELVAFAHVEVEADPADPLGVCRP